MWWWLAAQSASAGACCVGSVSAVPVRLGECETVSAALGAGAELATGRWDSDGALAPSAVDETAAVLTVGAGYRWSRWGQATVQLPGRVTHRQAGTLSEWGVGAGDVTLVSWADPFEEVYRPDGDLGPPVPVFGLGMRVPTGTAWDESDQPLASDVTGRPGVAALASVGVERTLGKVPWSLMAQAEMPTWRLSAVGTLGRYLGSRWTLVALARHEQALADGGGRDGGNARSEVGARVVHGQPVRWRAYAGVQTDVPLPAVGRSNPRKVEANAGFVWVR